MHFEFVSAKDSRYQDFRDRHYVANRGTHGQQIHFLIWEDDGLVGIISGASSVYAVKDRDNFFGITTQTRHSILPHIVNNTVFRLENAPKNYATQVLSKWRKVVPVLWDYLYETDVIGFETFVVENDTRKGTLYKADNWTYVGETAGSTKTHSGLSNPATRLQTDTKMIYCKWVKKPTQPKKIHIPTWRDPKLGREIAKRRKELLGKIYN